MVLAGSSNEDGNLRCWTLLFCDKGSKDQPTYLISESTSRQDVSHGSCTKKQMKGKVSGGFKENFAEIWPIDAESMEKLESVTQHIYRCSEDTEISVGSKKCTTKVHGITVEVCFEKAQEENDDDEFDDADTDEKDDDDDDDTDEKDD